MRAEATKPMTGTCPQHVVVYPSKRRLDSVSSRVWAAAPVLRCECSHPARNKFEGVPAKINVRAPHFELMPGEFIHVVCRPVKSLTHEYHLGLAASVRVRLRNLTVTNPNPSPNPNPKPKHFKP